MKKVFFPLLLTGAAFILSCNANDTKTAEKTTTETTKKETTSNTEGNTETKATAELCSCVNTFLADMSPKVRQILIEASKSENPVQVLTSELQKVTSEEEQLRLAREFERFENDQQLQKCSDDIKKKYNLDENNKESQQRVLKAAEENKECEVVYALMKIGMQQQNNATAPQQ